jgi:uncharacterized protein YbcC (UPF0753/DUF2309 family)/NADH:ubiquinone oxidoreductase subunit 5 (subunit L)/multisubunit Na+/H+ antiporter MnhA subunit
MYLAVTRVVASALTLLGAVAVGIALQGQVLELVVAEPAGISLGVRLDLLSSVLLTFVASLSWLVARYSGRNLAGQRRTTRFGALQLVALLSLAVLVTGASLPVVAAGWTASGLALAALVGHTGTRQALRAASYVRRRFLVGDLALWAGVGLAVLLLPSVDRAELADVVVDPVAATVVGLVLLVACATRSALVPAHRWLPETAEAPSPVSALLHAGIVNGTAVLLTLFWPLVAGAPAVLGGLVVLGAASVVVGTLAARARADVKGRLACSTTAQMGYMSVQLGLGLPAAAVVHLIGHGYYKSWLFLRAGGSVQRLRARPTASARGPVAAGAVPWVGVAAVTAVVLAAPAVLDGLRTIGPVVLLPALLTVAAIMVATTSAARDQGTSPRVRAGVAVGSAVVGAAYLWLLGGVETLLAGSLPKEPVWSSATAVVLVLALGVLGGALAALAARPTGAAVGRLDVLLAASAAPPWSRLVSGTARLPRLVTGGGPDGHAGVGETVDAVTATALVRSASRLVGPAWPARTIVAANPLAGLEDEAFEQATSRAGVLLGTSGVLPLTDYARLLEEGRIGRADLAAAVRQRAEDRGDPVEDREEVDRQVDDLIRAAASTPLHDGARSAPAPALRTFCAAVDRRSGGSRAAETSLQHAAMWTQRAWADAVGAGGDGTADDGEGEGTNGFVEASGPWRLWRSHAVVDGYDRVLGPRGTTTLVRDLPEDPAEALAALLTAAGLDAHRATEYVQSVLASAPGWAAHAAWRARTQGGDRPLVELVALRVALDLLVAGASVAEVPAAEWDGGTPGQEQETGTVIAGELEARHTWQLAYEIGYQEHLLTTLAPAAAGLASSDHPLDGGAGAARPEAQLVMCIDVRSERLRRHLEAAGPYTTYGFAGFFGVDLDVVTATGARFEQCPALIRPGHTVRVEARPTGLRAAASAAVAATGAAPLTPLLLAEAAGVAAGVAAAARTVAPARWGALARAWSQDVGPWDQATTELHLAADLDECVALAAGALRGTGLVDGFAPLLVLVGHAATMQNNAFATAYDCGACGGNGGQVNAQVLASLLNDPEVREGLAAQGLVLPADTVVVPAVHGTTTDEVVLDPSVEVPASHRERVERLEAALRVAGSRVGAERARTLPGAAIGTRAEDWSQPCPEWGLAGNAALVVGPRALTRGSDLDGRVFLHSYDPALDPDHEVLRTLLTAPLVVTQWINSQYYASTVDAAVLGAGDKTTHNVVGDVGVLTGAHGDLRLGLPWQALFHADPARGGRSRRHEPLRLLAVVWADPDAVLAVVRQHPAVADLVRNGWVRLVVLDPEDGLARRLTRSLAWQPCQQVPASDAVAA